MKRCLDVTLSLAGLIFLGPVLLLFMLAVWLQDFRSPLYMAPRVGRNGRMFQMVKLRSMVINADRSGVDSTAGDDPRITPVGKIIRRFKLDEFTQLWNVLKGDMSLVGPRPNVKRETDMYTVEEKRLLHVKPGITDFASIVFADEGEILKGSEDPDVAYNQLIRPWKSRLGLLYVASNSAFLDMQLVFLTLISIFSRSLALKLLSDLLARLGAPEPLVQIARRNEELMPTPPPGTDAIVVSRAQ